MKESRNRVFAFRADFRPGWQINQRFPKSRNLLERLCDFEDDVLCFTQVQAVPSTNNQGENDVRMSKLQQKISGCFRSFEGA